MRTHARKTIYRAAGMLLRRLSALLLTFLLLKVRLAFRDWPCTLVDHRKRIDKAALEAEEADEGDHGGVICRRERVSESCNSTSSARTCLCKKLAEGR